MSLNAYIYAKFIPEKNAEKLSWRKKEPSFDAEKVDDTLDYHSEEEWSKRKQRAAKVKSPGKKPASSKKKPKPPPQPTTKKVPPPPPETKPPTSPSTTPPPPSSTVPPPPPSSTEPEITESDTEAAETEEEGGEEDEEKGASGGKRSPTESTVDTTARTRSAAIGRYMPNYAFVASTVWSSVWMGSKLGIDSISDMLIVTAFNGFALHLAMAFLTAV
ncbi:unnamed protein product [Enterobius vermicularis]|uniref:CASP-like protein n=1 Tax=Enterobius vermicularis TaxID=51028 RepID=A0A0N4V624_ENTVE|nr:unnamed protein product [Enterobius vermicularis]